MYPLGCRRFRGSGTGTIRGCYVRRHRRDLVEPSAGRGSQGREKLVIQGNDTANGTRFEAARQSALAEDSDEAKVNAGDQYTERNQPHATSRKSRWKRVDLILCCHPRVLRSTATSSPVPRGYFAWSRPVPGLFPAPTPTTTSESQPASSWVRRSRRSSTSVRYSDIKRVPREM
jgi:hypothetical protein